MPHTVTARKKPRQARAVARVEKILEAALDLLVADGPEKLTTNHVAKAAGMSVGSLYQYFPNKQAILYELTDRWLTGLRQQLRNYLDDDSKTANSPEQLVDILTDAVFGGWVTGEAERSGEMALRQAMLLYPELRPLNYDHAREQIHLITEIAVRKFPDRDREDIRKKATFIYSMDLALEHAVELGLDPKSAIDSFKSATLSLL